MYSAWQLVCLDQAQRAPPEFHELHSHRFSSVTRGLRRRRTAESLDDVAPLAMRASGASVAHRCRARR